MEIKLNKRIKFLKADVEYPIQSYFYDITEEADIPEKAKDSIQERVDILVKDVYDLIDEADRDVNGIVEEFSPDEYKAQLEDLKYERISD